MRSVDIEAAHNKIKGRLSFPGDKSLSHRAILFGSLAQGVSRFTNVLWGEDCVCTRKAFEAMGVKIKVKSASKITVYGKGLYSLKKPARRLYLGNSGTSMRLLMGLLSAQPFTSELTGDPSLSSRPMKRVSEPLSRMGAQISGKNGGDLAPLTVRGAKLKGADIKLKVASAQVKSALLLAGLYAAGRTIVSEPVKSRDHSERFLKYFGAKISEKGNTVSIRSGQLLKARSFEIAGDISSAAFFMAIAALIPNAQLQFKSVLWNPTRTGVVKVMKRMGVQFSGLRIYQEGPEPVADFSIRAKKLRSFEISKEELPSLIDEIPILTVLATQAHGLSVIHDADELRVKETDRIHSMVTTLSKMGAKIWSQGNTLYIQGPTPLKGAQVTSFKDHRTAMSLIVAGLIASGKTRVKDVDCIDTSFPNFFELLNRIGVRPKISGGR